MTARFFFKLPFPEMKFCCVSMLLRICHRGCAAVVGDASVHTACWLVMAQAHVRFNLIFIPLFLCNVNYADGSSECATRVSSTYIGYSQAIFLIGIEYHIIALRERVHTQYLVAFCRTLFAHCGKISCTLGFVHTPLPLIHITLRSIGLVILQCKYRHCSEYSTLCSNSYLNRYNTDSR